MESKKSVGIWIRVSTEDQAKGESPEHHEKRARLYAEAKGWDVKAVYHLEAISGKSVINHPEARKMLADIKEGYITGLIFSKLARLARNTRELLDFADTFRDCGADLVSLQESIDTSSPAGRLFYTMIAAMAQWEREEIADRVAASVPIRAKLGKPIGGQASFGYQWVSENPLIENSPKKLVINEKEAPIRKLMYELFAVEKRKKTVARLLNEKGYRTRNGSNFSNTTVDRLLRDTTAKGIRIANYSKSLGEGKNWVLKPKEEWILLECPAIVSIELWEECNRILDDQDSKQRKPGPKSVHLLSGFVTCHCGKKMYVFHEAQTYACKKCKNRISVADLDEIYHEQLKSFLLTESDLNDYLQKSNETLQEKMKLLELVLDESRTAKKKMDELLDMRLNGELNRENFPKLYKPFEDRFMQLEEQLPQLQAEIDFLKIEYFSSGTVIKEAQDLYDHWLNLPFDQKRNIVETITESITIDKEDITINLAYLPSISQNGGKRERNFRGSVIPTTVKR